MNLANEIKNITDEYANVFIQEVNSFEELINQKNEFDNENSNVSWCITADSYMKNNILITEYCDSDDLFDGHVICIYHKDATNEDILAFCKDNLLMMED